MKKIPSSGMWKFFAISRSCRPHSLKAAQEGRDSFLTAPPYRHSVAQDASYRLQPAADKLRCVWLYCSRKMILSHYFLLKSEVFQIIFLFVQFELMFAEVFFKIVNQIFLGSQLPLGFSGYTTFSRDRAFLFQNNTSCSSIFPVR